MAYYTKVLLPDEQVRAIARLHWAIYLRAWLCLIVALAAGIGYLHMRSAAGTQAVQGDPAALVLAAVGGVFLVLGLIMAFFAWVRRITTEIVVTDRRIIFKQGFIQRRTMEMNIDKVETVDVLQSIWGRILNYGTVSVRGTGSTYEPLRLIGNPLALRTAIVAR